MSLACLATLVPEPKESPTWARFKAGASLVPSPVTATTSPRSCKRATKRCLSMGRALDITFNSPTASKASSSLRHANSAPLIILCPVSSEPSEMIPVWRAISKAVAAVSPVTIFTSIPAWRHWLIASGTSARKGSLIATMANSVLLTAIAKVRIACCCHSYSCCSTC